MAEIRNEVSRLSGDVSGRQGKEIRDTTLDEAAWSPEGAVFLNRTRYPNTLAQLQQECPKTLQAVVYKESESASRPILTSKSLVFSSSITRL